MVSNRMILVASWYRHDEKLGGQKMSLAIKAIRLRCVACGTVLLKPHILQIVFFNNRQKKVGYHMTLTLRIDGDSCPTVVLAEGRSIHTLEPKSTAKSDFFWR